jgi:hypothetical protein
MVALNDEGTEDVPDLTESSDEDSTTALTDLVSHLSILHPQDEVPQDEVTSFQLLDGHHRLEAAVILHPHPINLTVYSTIVDGPLYGAHVDGPLYGAHVLLVSLLGQRGHRLHDDCQHPKSDHV